MAGRDVEVVADCNRRICDRLGVRRCPRTAKMVKIVIEGGLVCRMFDGGGVKVVDGDGEVWG